MAKATLLVIDDFEPSLTSRREYFETFQYRVLTAIDGNTGLELMKHEHVDLVILDYAMPVMSGGEIAAIIRHNYPKLPIILVSGHPVESLDLPAGLVDATYVKGERMSILRKIVDDLLAARS